ncbi:uncharacterized protein LOC128962398 [Oppia nitens]|uniref:uncharacterized protein LOC128962398 n=1 Tax=Oppia nitens TaxID=1686743 RepID=UPI0023DB0709|nr:uncharacterized protein LOC128962398 [Oppia nitens]
MYQSLCGLTKWCNKFCYGYYIQPFIVTVNWYRHQWFRRQSSVVTTTTTQSLIRQCTKRLYTAYMVDSKPEDWHTFVAHEFTVRKLAKVLVYDPRRGLSTGSACIVAIDTDSRHVYAVTNEHVAVQGIFVQLVDYEDYLIEYGKVVYAEPEHDLSLIVLRPDPDQLQGLMTFQMSTTETEFGAPVLAIGFAVRDLHNMCTGIIHCPENHRFRHIISRLNTQTIVYDTNSVMLGHTAPIAVGYSGGPLVDIMNGKLIAVNSLTHMESRSSIPAYYIQDFVTRAMNSYDRQRENRDNHCTIKWGLCLKFSLFHGKNIVQYVTFEQTPGNHMIGMKGFFGVIDGQQFESLDEFVDIMSTGSNDGEQPIDVKYLDFAIKRPLDTQIYASPNELTYLKAI